ncbi:hypothetical protein M5689_001441 [Euphorbia peplus]|nr:hypothetical protein M5689_001441 [Euphorbia peplus]
MIRLKTKLNLILFAFEPQQVLLPFQIPGDGTPGSCRPSAGDSIGICGSGTGARSRGSGSGAGDGDWVGEGHSWTTIVIF